MATFVYNGLPPEVREKLRESMIRQLKPRIRIRGTESPRTMAELKRKRDEFIESETVHIDRQLDERDAGFDFWGLYKHKAHPLALRFNKGQPVDVEEPPKPREGAKFLPEVNKRWKKLEALVASGTLCRVEEGAAPDAGGPPATLRHMKADEAMALIEATDDADLLLKWVDTEKRQGVGEALEARIAKLSAAS